MIALLFFFATLNDSSSIKVNLLSGQELAGPLVKLSQQSVELKTGSPPELKRIPMHEVVNVEWQRAESIHSARAQLTDGTSLAVKSVMVQNDLATIELNAGPNLTLPVKQLHVLVPTAISNDEWRDWRNKSRKKRASDTLTVLKLQKRFELEGIVGAINKENLSFTLDNEEMKVKKDRIVAVQYANSTDASKVRAEIYDKLGNVWAAETFVVDDAGVTCKTQSGVERRISFAEIARLDFSAGKVIYLSDLEPSLMQHTPFFDHAWDYRRDKDLTGATLRIGDVEYAKGLAVHSRTVLEYELGQRTGTLMTSVGIADAAGPFGDAIVRFSGDGKLLQEVRCRANQDAQKVSIALSGVSKIVLEVDYGERYDLGDHVIFGNARFVPVDDSQKAK